MHFTALILSPSKLSLYFVYIQRVTYRRYRLKNLIYGHYRDFSRVEQETVAQASLNIVKDEGCLQVFKFSRRRQIVQPDNGVKLQLAGFLEV